MATSNNRSDQTPYYSGWDYWNDKPIYSDKPTEVDPTGQTAQPWETAPGREEYFRNLEEEAGAGFTSPPVNYTPTLPGVTPKPAPVVRPPVTPVTATFRYEDWPFYKQHEALLAQMGQNGAPTWMVNYARATGTANFFSTLYKFGWKDPKTGEKVAAGTWPESQQSANTFLRTWTQWRSTWSDADKGLVAAQKEIFDRTGHWPTYYETWVHTKGKYGVDPFKGEQVFDPGDEIAPEPPPDWVEPTPGFPIDPGTGRPIIPPGHFKPPAPPTEKPLGGGWDIPRLAEPELPADIEERSPLGVFYGTQGLEPGGSAARGFQPGGISQYLPGTPQDGMRPDWQFPEQVADQYPLFEGIPAGNLGRFATQYRPRAAAQGGTRTAMGGASRMLSAPGDDEYEPLPGGGGGGGGGRVQFPSEAESDYAQADYYRAQAERLRQAAGEARGQLDFERERLYLNEANKMEQQAREIQFRGIELERTMEQRSAELASSERIASQRADVERATARGFFEDDQPTLERELAVAESMRRNAEVLARRAEIAGNFREAELQRQEGARQYNRSQTLQEQIQRGHLGLAGRAQTEAERTGAFQRERTILESPGGFLGGVYAARGQTRPNIPELVGVGGDDLRPGKPMPFPRLEDDDRPWGQLMDRGLPPSPAQARAPALSYEDIARSPATPSGVKYGFGAENLPAFRSPFPVPTQQRLGQLMPSERESYFAGTRALGYNPEDVAEESRRLTGTSQPPTSRRIMNYPRLAA